MTQTEFEKIKTANGICVRCKQEAEPGKKLCKRHLLYDRQRGRRTDVARIYPSQYVSG